LSVWSDLSDVKLAEALDDRASFRRFCGFSGSEPVPERTAFVRFRKALVAAGLDRSLFEAVTGQLKAKAVGVKTGTIIDATIIASASEGMSMPAGLSTGASRPFTGSRRIWGLTPTPP
jgi:IS5 family transposase